MKPAVWRGKPAFWVEQGNVKGSDVAKVVEMDKKKYWKCEDGEAVPAKTSVSPP